MAEVDRSKWVVNLQGKDYPTWPYALDEAHKRGLKRLECELVQIPSAENGNVAIVKATAEFAKPPGDNPFVDCLFSAYGDASPGNVNHKMAGAIIRMAETRAKGRCLRDACNIGMTLAEEMPDDDPMGGAEHSRGAMGNAPVQGRPPQPAARGPVAAASRPAAGAAAPVGAGATLCAEPGCGVILTKNQITMSQHKSGGLFCTEHLPLHLKDG